MSDNQAVKFLSFDQLLLIILKITFNVTIVSKAKIALVSASKSISLLKSNVSGIGVDFIEIKDYRKS